MLKKDIECGWICPVCGGRLSSNGCSYICGLSHCFDIAKSGYVNLILSSKSLHGDSREMIRARHAFLSSGHYGILRDALCDTLRRLPLAEKDSVILDAGCGECYYTEAVKNAFPEVTVLGIDLSKDALSIGGKRRAGIELAAASVNAVPLCSDFCDAVLSVFSPLAASEFYRVLKPDGVLVHVIPLARHLYGMKQIIYRDPYENTELRDAPEGFVQISERQISGNIHLTHDELLNLFTMTPYFYRTSSDGKKRLDELDTLDTEIGFGIIVYGKKK